MKKIFLILALLFTVSCANAQRFYLPGGGYIYYALDSNYFRMSHLTLFPFGIKSFGTSYMYGDLRFDNSDNIYFNGGGLYVNGGGNINVNGGAYFLDGTNFNSIFGRVGYVNTWTQTNTYNGLSYFNKDIDISDSVYVHGARINVHDGSYQLEGVNLLNIISDSLQKSFPSNTIFYSKAFTQNSGKYFNQLQQAIDSAADRMIVVYADTVTENIKANTLNLYLMQGAVLNAPAYYSLRADSTKAVNWKIRGEGTINGIKIDNNANNNVCDIQLSSISGLGTNPAVKCYWTGTNPSFYLKYNFATGYSTAIDLNLGSSGYKGTVEAGYTTTTAGKYIGGESALKLEMGDFTFTKPFYVLGNCGTVVSLTNAKSTFNMLDVKNLNDTGHCVRLYSSQVYGSFKKIDNRNSVLYSAINHVNSSYGRVNLIDTVHGGGSMALEEDASSDLFIDGGFFINNTNTGANVTVLVYGGGQISNSIIKNLASTDARCLDIGNGGTKKFTFLNCYIQGNSTWALAGVGGNSGNITFRNTLFQNDNTSSYTLRNYYTTYLSILAYNSNTNVPNYALDSHRFIFPYDSLRVKMPAPQDTIYAAYDTTKMATRNYANHRVDSALAGYTGTDTSKLKHKSDSTLSTGYATRWYAERQRDSSKNWALERFGRQFGWKGIISQADTNAPTLDKFLWENFTTAGSYQYTSTSLTRVGVGTYSLIFKDENNDPMEIYGTGSAWGVSTPTVICPLSGTYIYSVNSGDSFYFTFEIVSDSELYIYTYNNSNTLVDNAFSGFYFELWCYY